MFDVSGRNAIITGSAQGIGKAMAERLLSMGCKVCISDVNDDVGKKTLEEFQAKFGQEKVIFVRCNVTNVTDWKALWAQSETSLGQISVLVCCAGINRTFPLLEIIEVNLIGTIHGVQLALEKMSKSKGGIGGRIITLGSISSFGLPWNEEFPSYGYYISKTGVTVLTRALKACDQNWVEMEGIKCYSVCPGPVDTAFIQNTLKKKQVEMEQFFGTKFATPNDVVDKTMEMFKMDRNGACYPVFKEHPMTNLEYTQTFFLYVYLATCKLLKFMGFQRTFVDMKMIFIGYHLLVFLTFWIFFKIMSVLIF